MPKYERPLIVMCYKLYHSKIMHSNVKRLNSQWEGQRACFFFQNCNEINGGGEKSNKECRRDFMWCILW